MEYTELIKDWNKRVNLGLIVLSNSIGKKKCNCKGLYSSERN